jgi:hypothetical protein
MKITKILVALSFLFAVASANAGTMTVTGGMQATYQTEQDATTGNPLGMDTELTFSGSTELDSGITVTVMQDYAGDSSSAMTFGNSQIAFGNIMGMATIYVGSDSDPLDAIDDITPSAFEEANATSGTHSDVGTNAGELGIGLKVSLPILGDVNAKYFPKTDTTKNGDKAASTNANAAVGSGSSISLKTPLSGLPVVGGALDGLVLTTGYAEAELSRVANTDKEVELTAALNYTRGPLSLGYQKKYDNDGQVTAAADAAFTKADIYGIAYAINDSLTVSYNRYESYKHNINATGAAGAAAANIGGADAKQDTSAINIGYTVGGMTFGFQDAQTDNAGYIKNAKDDTRTVSVVVAF